MKNLNAKLFFYLLLFSPIAVSAGAAGDGVPKVVLFQAINFIIFSSVLYWIASKKMGTFFSERVEKHEKAKQEAVRAFTEAQQKHQEVKQRLASLVEDEEKAVSRAQEEAKLLKSKLIHEAEELAKSIVEDSKKTSLYEFDKARAQLRKDVFETALALSKKQLVSEMDKENHKNLQKDFVESVGTQA